MPHQITVTSKTGPDRTLTAAVLQNVNRMDFDLNDKILQVYVDNQAGNQIKEFDLSAAATMTVSIATGNWTIVLA